MADSLLFAPDHGMEICYECDGERACWRCEGTGAKDGASCLGCGGVGTCIVCAGAGQLALGSGRRAIEASGKRVAIQVGCFRELGYNTLLTLADARGRRPLEHVAEVVAYLRGARVLVMSPGTVRDVFDPSTTAGARHMRTDGVFAWPDALAHYVARYAVELPPTFEAHMAGLNWIPPRDIELKGLWPSP